MTIRKLNEVRTPVFCESKELEVTKEIPLGMTIRKIKKHGVSVVIGISRVSEYFKDEVVDNEYPKILHP